MSTDLLHEGYRVGQAAGTDSNFVPDGRGSAEPKHRGIGLVRRSPGCAV